MTGLEMAAAYAIKPNILKRCGPEHAHKILFDFVTGKRVFNEKRIRELLSQFQVAMPYYTLIARANSISDPFDNQVVEAYWIGNELLDQVTPEAVRQVIEQDVKREGWDKKQIAIMFQAIALKHAKPHHSLSVLYFFTRPGIKLDPTTFNTISEQADQCRVCVGIIQGRDHLEVSYLPLIFGSDRIIKIGSLVEKEIEWGLLSMINPNLTFGSVVSFHHNWGIQILSLEQVENLKKYTRMTLEAINP